MSKDFDREDDLQFFARNTDDELREMDALHQNAGSCVISTICIKDWHEGEEMLTLYNTGAQICIK